MNREHPLEPGDSAGQHDTPSPSGTDVSPASETPVETSARLVSGELSVLLVTGGIWATRPVKEQPHLILTSWSVRQLPDGDRHFVGYCETNREGRVSSKIRQFDPVRRRGVTSTGRVYELRGRPGHDSDAEYVWNRWARMNLIESYVDVSRELLADGETP